MSDKNYTRIASSGRIRAVVRLIENLSVDTRQARGKSSRVAEKFANIGRITPFLLFSFFFLFFPSHAVTRELIEDNADSASRGRSRHPSALRDRTSEDATPSRPL